jgi:hypothetical protein
MGRDAADIHFNMFQRKGDPLNWRGDNAKLRRVFKDEFIDLKAGLTEYAQWINKINAPTNPNQ